MSSNVPKNRPSWVLPVIGFLIGLLIGWWVIGWGLWPSSGRMRCLRICAPPSAMITSPWLPSRTRLTGMPTSQRVACRLGRPRLSPRIWQICRLVWPLIHSRRRGSWRSPSWSARANRPCPVDRRRPRPFRQRLNPGRRLLQRQGRTRSGDCGLSHYPAVASSVRSSDSGGGLLLASVARRACQAAWSCNRCVDASNAFCSSRAAIFQRCRRRGRTVDEQLPPGNGSG